MNKCFGTCTANKTNPFRRHNTPTFNSVARRSHFVYTFPVVSFLRKYDDEFVSYFPTLVESLIQSNTITGLPDMVQRFTTLLQYNVLNGQKVKGVTAVVSYRMLEKPGNLTEDNLKLANILGWCVELLETFVGLIEEIVKNSETCPNGYKLPGVSQATYMEVFNLEQSIYYLLKKYFSTHTYYSDMVQLVQDMIRKTTTGQILDSQKYRFDDLTMDLYNRITEYKTGYRSFYFPVTLAMYYSKIYDNEVHKQATLILLEMGKYVQIQNEMRTNLNDPTTLFKDGKCNWLTTVVLQKATPSQRQVLESNYISKDVAIKQIQSLCKILDIPGEFLAYEEQSFKSLYADISKIHNNSVRNLLFTLIGELYDRKLIV
ncbi:hypothetical protein NQ315_009543 [Exocentrus adspersus]|uniref:Farnesyl pyrophosphate synthase n=1 Tax=Exocentrus adspersus TaxID=1586481 RepID=A0AAV8WGW7_9CUCU|nr:hypothetical protein NQ315_009543 [Exocentrus adspersus]